MNSSVVLNIDVKDSGGISKATTAINNYLGNASKASKETENLSKAHQSLNKGVAALQKGFNTVNSHLSKMTVVTGGVTLGIGALISESFHLGKTIVSMRNELKHLSDTTGDVSGAWGVAMNVWGKSIASLATIKGSMTGLANAGMQVGPAMQNLALYISDIHQASGLSVDKMATLTGELNSYWGVSVKGSREVVSSVLAAQKAFGSTTAQMEQFMGTIIESQNRLGALGKDGEVSAKALAKGITMASGTLIKMGVSAQTAGDFINKMLDPDRIDETSGLMRRLGISVEEQFKMMESGTGKEMFFDKMLTNLPKLSQEIQSIANPMARWQYAKGMGLPPEIAMKLASASGSQMRSVIEDYKAQAQDEKAAEEKRKKATADAARFDEQMMFLKMNILSPMIGFVMNMFNEIQKKSGGFTAFLQKVVGGIASILKGIWNIAEPLIDYLNGDIKSDAVSQRMADAAQKFGTILGEVIKTLAPPLILVGAKVVKGVIGALWELLKSHPGIMLILGGGILGKFAFSMATLVFQLKAMGVIGGPGGGLLKSLGGMASGVGGKLSGAGMLFKAGASQAMGVGASGLMSAGTAKAGTGLLSKLALGAGGQFAGLAGGLGKVGALAGGGVGAGAALIAIPAAMLAGGIGGGMMANDHYMKERGTKATGSEKLGMGLAGALTLGIAPLIDKLTGTKATAKIGEGISSLSKSPLALHPASLTNPIVLWMKVAEAFQDKVFKKQEQIDYDMIQGKRKRGEQLTESEKKREQELFKIKQDNYTTVSQGFRNMWKGIKNFFSEIGDFFKNISFDKVIESANKFFIKIATWFGEKLGLPLFKLLGGLDIAIDQLLNGLESWFANSGVGRQFFNYTDEDRAKLKIKEEQLSRAEKAHRDLIIASDQAGMSGYNELSNLNKTATVANFGEKYGPVLKFYSQMAMNVKKSEQKEIEEEKLKLQKEANEKLDKANKLAGAVLGAQQQIAENTKKSDKSEADFLSSFIGNYGMASMTVKVQ